MLGHGTEPLTFDRLMGALQGPTGWLELAIAVVCVLLAYGLTRRIYTRYFGPAPDSWGFGKYLAYRLVFPLSAQLLMQLGELGWHLVHHGKSELLLVIATLLFWLSVIRVLTAVVRHALPSGKFERNGENFVAMLLWLGFASWATGFDVVVVDWLESISFRVGKNEINLLMILSALVWVSVIMVGALWVSKLIEKKVMRLGEVDLNLRLVFIKLARTLLIITAVLVALPIVGIDLTVLSVFGGALGVGLGFGLQKIASNYVSGFIILLERSIRIGDRLMVENRTGYVSKITSRYVVLKTSDGSEALVPNDTLIASTVVNQSYSDKALWISLPVQVAYGTDLDQALLLLRQAAEHPRVKQDPAPASFVVAFAEAGINLELGIWVRDPENGMLGLRSDINLRIWRLFGEHDIQIPYPQREVRLLNGPAEA
ncbi:mechanosensitive ion channel family protein [Vogesella sp. LIG4]|uniref:mechanosensitive ion channel family protein n=1 Tax=Vogesella sp. LIG4 TaxID=1192162 RepID=UPI00081F8A3A|nr:mechanosensitive ion channel domain-containing protein [Vogesella sp. LIG4]SCK22739.1 Small-conductance mechanosensitive channel [Vogesella sp. LIG4]